MDSGLIARAVRWTRRPAGPALPVASLLRPVRTLPGMLMAIALLSSSGPACAARRDDAAEVNQATPPASVGAYRTFTPTDHSGRLHYLASRDAGDTAPVAALIALHGHPRDGARTFAVARQALPAGAATVVVAPVFQVAAEDATGCPGPGVPAAEPGDALWTCSSWIAGEAARDGGLTAFAALDALVAEVLHQWPGVRTITLAGFSAGAQLLQHSVGFAAAAPAGVTLRYVIADPGSWLYFDPVRPQPMGDGHPVDGSACGWSDEACAQTFAPADASACPGVNRWKYGTEGLPAGSPRDAAEARAHYAAAEVHYVAGERDDHAGPGTASRLLDRSCAAMAQGPFRRQRSEAYAAYDRAVLAPGQNRQVTIAAGCAHDVACVWADPAVKALLAGRARR